DRARGGVDAGAARRARCLAAPALAHLGALAARGYGPDDLDPLAPEPVQLVREVDRGARVSGDEAELLPQLDRLRRADDSEAVLLAQTLDRHVAVERAGEAGVR